MPRQPIHTSEQRFTRVALYTRVSTDLQANKEEGSLDTQEARLRAAIQSRSGTYDITYVFREEGESGKSLDRPALQRMLEHVRRGDIDLIIVTRIDRLSRSLLDFYEMHRLFEKHGVQFVSLNETFDTSSAVGRAMLKLVLVFAELEREQTAERTRLAIQARAERGLWNGGAPPLGYTSLKGGRLEVNPLEAERVKTIFAQYLELRSSQKVALWLTQNGLRQKVFQSRRKGDAGGNEFNISVVRLILTNRLYLGEIEHKGQVFKGQHEALIDPETFERVQAIMAANTLVPTAARAWAQYDYLLTGLLRCSCGYALTTSAGRGNGGNYHYYRCTGLQKRVQHTCEVKQIRAERIDEAVLSIVRDAAREPTLIAEAIREANRLARAAVQPLQERVSVLKRELMEAERRAQDLLASILTSGISESSTAKKVLLEAEKRQVQLREALSAAEGELVSKSTEQLDLEVAMEALRSFDRSYQHLTLDEKREFLRHMLKEVTVYPDRVEVELYEGKQAIRLLEGAGRGKKRDTGDIRTISPRNPAETPLIAPLSLNGAAENREDTANMPPVLKDVFPQTNAAPVCGDVVVAPHWPLMDVLAASLFQSRWNDEEQQGPAVRDDSELANLLFSKGDQREKGDLLLRYDDCFLEVGVAPPSVSTRILHELIHRRKHLTPGGITLLMGRFSLGKLSELLCSVSPSLEHAMNELLPSLIGDRYFYLGDSDAKKEEAVRG